MPVAVCAFGKVEMRLVVREKTLNYRLSRILACCSTVALSIAAPQAVLAQSDLARLAEEFVAPPADARPWTWFHVMSGNMTREGLTKDLEAIAEAGIGGIVLFHATQGISYGPVKFNSPEHIDLIIHAAAECERLGIKFNFHNADGWSSSGGPWITPEQSMKRVVSSQALVDGGRRVDLRLPQPATRAGFYRDIAVIAYPALDGEIADAARPARLTSSDPTLDLSRLTDGNAETKATIAVPRDEAGWVQFSYPEPVTIEQLQVANIRFRDVEADLQVSEDGIVFRKIATFPKTRVLRDEWNIHVNFAPVTGRYFRVGFTAGFEFGELTLSQAGGSGNVVARTSVGHVFGKDLPALPNLAAGDVIDQGSIIDLSGNMDADGRLRASLPAGAWTIMRFGYTSTAALNVNPSREGEGLEVDKFDAAAFRAHHTAFIKPLVDRVRAVAPTAMNGVMIDSYEVGGQNWTEGYEALFKKEYGVDLIRWLPLYAGRMVEDANATGEMFERIRSLNSSLMHKNYYREFADIMAAEELESFIQPYGNGPFDEIAVGAIASTPAGEFWVRRNDLVRLNSSVSAGRLYNKPVIAAEAFTGIWDDNWNFNPAFGKRYGDLAWVHGVNQFMFHRFAHQANTHVVPGMTMNRWGSHFDRTQPWWDEGGRAWFGYMARGQHLLRQGLGVADVALLVGSGTPVECPEKPTAQGVLPAGVEFDCLDTPTLLDRGRFERGAFVLPNGARYGMLWWPHAHAPRPAELARMEQARAAGVPVAMTNLGDDPAHIFTAAGLTPRVSANGPLPAFTQRKAGERDIFFTFNDADETRRFDLCFRVDGKAGELWNPVNGTREAVAGQVGADGCSRIDVTLAPYESRFVVFDNALQFRREPAAAPVQEQVLARLDDSWTLSFDPFYGAAGTLTNVALFDWSTSTNSEIRHFSGKATYSRQLAVSAKQLAVGGQMWLDLGQVANVASVRVNGVDMGTLWTAPYRTDIRRALRAGNNKIEIELANLWVNRLIGDAALPDTSGYLPEQNIGYRPADNLPLRNMVEWYSANQPPPPGPRRTFATQYFQKADDPLVPAGLIGPVKLFVEP